jgi:protein-disulfide isomerase
MQINEEDNSRRKPDLRRLILLLFSFLIFVSSAPAQNSGLAKTKGVVAVVGGQPVMEDDLLPFVQAQSRQLRNQEYEMTSKALENLINQRLVDAEAKKKGVSNQKLIEQEVDSKITEPTDSEVAAYYLGRKGTEPLEDVKETLRKGLKQARIQQAREQYVRGLRQRAEVIILLRPPKVQVSYDPARLRGDPKAPVTIVEFSDFECPYCRRAEAVVEEMLAKHAGEVRLAYRDFPLRQIHPDAQSAAEASHCAEEQGKFWEYHDALFAAPKPDRETQLQLVRNLGLDEQKFDACISSRKYVGQIEQDLQDGVQAGVSGTPGFFINGIALSGAQPASEFEKIILSEIAAAKHAAQPVSAP